MFGSLVLIISVLIVDIIVVNNDVCLRYTPR